MKKIIALLSVFSMAVYGDNVTSSFSTGTAITISWYSDTAYTHALALPGAMEGQTIYGVLSAAATATTYGAFNGTLTTIDSTHVKYVAPATLTACHTVDGLQPMPCDSPFFTDISSMPLVSSHYMGDGSGYCEATVTNNGIGPLCQGSPTAGTGWYTQVDPPGGSCPLPVKTEVPGTYKGCASNAVSILYVSDAGTTQETIMTGHEPINWSLKGGEQNDQVTVLPDIRLKQYENRQGGNFRLERSDCSKAYSSTSPYAFDGPIPAFPSCPTTANGGVAPHPTGGEDMHTFAMDPLNTTKTWEWYADVDRFGASSGCAQPANARTCNGGSARQLDWAHYLAQPAMGLAGTPEVQLELTDEDLDSAAVYGKPINHALVGTLGFNAGGEGKMFVWPASGPNYNAQTWDQKNQTLPVMGQRFRLSSTRTSTNYPILSGITITNVGSGYTPGQVLTGTVTGCTALSGGPASAIAFVGPSGSVSTSGISSGLAFITNTGQSCSSPTITFPAPTSGTTATATLSTFSGAYTSARGSTYASNVATAVYNEYTHYGVSYDDTSNHAGLQYRTNGSYFTQPEHGVVDSQMLGGGANFGNPYLWDMVDISSLLPSAAGFPASTQNQNSGMAAYWIADSGASSAVPMQAMIKLTATVGGTVTFVPIPLLGVGVGSSWGSYTRHLTIASGMSAYQLGSPNVWVTGDPTNAGLTYSFVTDPCPGDSAEALTSGGLYTPCAQFATTANKVGIIKAASVANPNAYALIEVHVVGTDAQGNIRIDSGGSGAVISGTGEVWSADADCSITQIDYGSCTASDYPGWLGYGHFGGPSAPMSKSTEHAIYESQAYRGSTSNGDVGISMVVPNGNYQVRVLSGETYNGGNQNSYRGPDWHSFMAIEANGVIQKWSACFICRSENQPGTPVDWIVPVKVTNNVLAVRVAGYEPSRYAGEDIWTANGGPQEAEIAGMAFYKDTTTTPHWVIGNYSPYRFLDGDSNTIDLSDGVHTTLNPNGYPYTGMLQLYIQPWFTNDPTDADGNDVPDPVWTLVSGPGTLSSTGLYVAPATAPNGNACAVIKAQSASNAGIVAQTQICIKGLTSFSYR